MSQANFQQKGRITLYHVPNVAADANSICLNVRIGAGSDTVNVYFTRDEAGAIAGFLTVAIAEHDAEHAKVAA